MARAVFAPQAGGRLGADRTAQAKDAIYTRRFIGAQESAAVMDAALNLTVDNDMCL